MKRGGHLYKFFNACAGGVLVKHDVLKPLRAAAAKSPTATAALKWFEKQNIDIVFDDKLAARKVAGRYSRKGDKRRIILPLKFMEKDVADRLDTLVHEIRHAWQDQNGLMLPYSFMFNMQYGMQQAFLLLCIEEADAHVNGMTAGIESLGDKVSLLGQQALFIDWFNTRMPSYLDTFVKEWADILTDLQKDMQGDTAKMQRYLERSKNVGDHTIDTDRLVKIGAAFGRDNYMADANFHEFVADTVLPAAKIAYRVKQGDEIVTLTSTMDQLRALAPANLRQPKAGRAA